MIGVETIEASAKRAMIGSTPSAEASAPKPATDRAGAAGDHGSRAQRIAPIGDQGSRRERKNAHDHRHGEHDTLGR